MVLATAQLKRLEILVHDVLDEEAWEHTQRVRKRALSFALYERLSIEQKEVLETAAILHDICVSSGISEHAQEGADQARRVLINMDVPTEFINRVCHCIETHNEFAKARPQTIEAKVLFDADSFEFIGPLGIVRFGLCFKKSEADSTRSLKDRIYVAGKKRMDQLYTEAGKKAVQEYWEYEKQFFAELEKQLSG